MAPLISVALSTYNGARYLPAQLDSLLAQRDVSLEIVAVDDGSGDDTVAILADYAARDGRLRWERNPHNLGPTRSFERALSLCRGDFLAPCDQDDVWQPHKLARLLAAIGGRDLAYCDSEYVDADGKPQGRCVSDHLAMLQGTSPVMFLFANSVSGHASLLRRDLFETARPFPDGVYHDWWLALCAAGRNGVVCVPEALVQFRRHEAVCSPMGRSGNGHSRTPEASRAWLEQRYRLMQGYAATAFREHECAAALAGALRAAIDHADSGPLLRLLWRYRRGLPPWSGVPMLDALKLHSRLARKLRRAHRVATVPPATAV